MSEVRLAKYETLIEDINSKIKKNVLTGGRFALARHSSGYSNYNVALSLIFDYDSCNEYAKVIIEKSELYITPSDNNYSDKWKERYPNIASLSDAKTKIDAAKLFVQYCRESQNKSEGYKFIFWSLMILTVDKNNADEYLSLICDFAKMLRITNEEFEDIIYTIKCVYNKVHKGYFFKSEIVLSVFGSLIYSLIDMYDNQNTETSTNPLKANISKSGLLFNMYGNQNTETTDIPPQTNIPNFLKKI